MERGHFVASHRVPASRRNCCTMLGVFEFTHWSPAVVTAGSQSLSEGSIMFSSRLRFWFLLAYAAAATFAATAQAKRPGLKAEDIFNLQTASDPQISPDGQRIVYVRGFADIMTDRRHANLWIINADGSNHRPLTSGLSNDSSPRWSPDGTRIAYISGEDGHSQIFVRWMDTGQTARITALESAPSGLEWSPDGRQISFATFVPPNPSNWRRCRRRPQEPSGRSRRSSTTNPSIASTPPDT